MANIYDQHTAAFANVSAYVVMKGGESVATIAFKFPKDGAGRLYAYVHWVGIEMVRGHANGYGYDKKSASVANAVGKLPVSVHNPDCRDAQFINFKAALQNDNGYDFEYRLREVGFTVHQAV